MVAAACLTLGVGTAAARASVTVDDPDDVGARLDVRSVTVAPIRDGEMARVTVTFWSRGPAWLLRRHPVHVDLGVERSPVYVQAFFRNDVGRVRLTWGESGSNCCFTRPAGHPDRFTYTAKFPNLLGAAPPPEYLRGWSSRRVDCDRRRCYLFEGRILDRTRWASI